MSAPLGAQQWAGTGFSGPGQMTGSTAIIASLGAKGVINVDEYFLEDKVPSKVIRGSTRMAFTAGPESFYNDQYNTVYIAFQIDFNSSKAIPTTCSLHKGQHPAIRTFSLTQLKLTFLLPLLSQDHLQMHALNESYGRKIIGFVLFNFPTSRLERLLNIC